MVLMAHSQPLMLSCLAAWVCRLSCLSGVLSVCLSVTELDHWAGDPTDPRMLAADRRLAALTASLGSNSNAAAMAAAMV